jgi:hypothetical protein
MINYKWIILYTDDITTKNIFLNTGKNEGFSSFIRQMITFKLQMRLLFLNENSICTFAKKKK